jgi:hypothetical protein
MVIKTPKAIPMRKMTLIRTTATTTPAMTASCRLRRRSFAAGLTHPARAVAGAQVRRESPWGDRHPVAGGGWAATGVSIQFSY